MRCYRSADAGELRGFLAEDLAAIDAAGFVPPCVLERFERRLRRLVRLSGLSRSELLLELREDAVCLVD